MRTRPLRRCATRSSSLIQRRTVRVETLRKFATSLIKKTRGNAAAVVLLLFAGFFDTLAILILRSRGISALGFAIVRALVVSPRTRRFDGRAQGRHRCK